MSALDLSIFPRRRVKHIRQSEATECGLACLAMISNHHGHDLDVAALRVRHPASSRGMGLRQLMQVSDSLGLVPRPLKLDLDSLDKIAVPAILHWDMNHFVVVERVHKGRALVHDPAGTTSWHDRASLDAHFSGVALELRPGPEFSPVRERHDLKLSQLWSDASGIRRTVAQALLLSLVLQAYVLASPYFLQSIVDNAIPTLDGSLVLMLVVGFGLFALVNAGATLIRSMTLLASGTALSFGISSNVARRLMRLPIAWFEKRSVGDILSRFQSVQPIQRLLVESAPAAIIDGLLTVLTLVVMALYSPTLAAVAVGASLLYLALRAALLPAERRDQAQRIVEVGREQGTMIETLRGIVPLRLSGRETMRHAVWQGRLADHLSTGFSVERLRVLREAGYALISGVEIVVLVGLAAKMAIAGGFSVGMLFAFLAYRMQFSVATRSLVDKWIDLRMLSVHLHRLGDIAMSDEDSGFDELSTDPAEMNGGIELRGVRYAYSKADPEVLKGVDLRIDPGEHVAITGPSGGGKSTLVKIILGLVDPTDGHILVDGRPLASFGRRAWREGVGAVMQDDLLFAGTIADNVAGFEPVDEQRLTEALRAAQILDDVDRMPSRHFTPVGDMGSTLSGGQKQRILLARALYRRPKVLVMDEGTAHLDPAHERAVGRAISDMGITRIVIAHRKETISAADRVVVLDGGRIVDPA